MKVNLNNLNNKKDINYTIDEVINILFTKRKSISDTYRYISSEYNIISLNLLENIPKIIRKDYISTLYSVYNTICMGDYTESKYLDKNIDTDKNVKLITSVSPEFNRLILTENVKHGPWHSVRKINCPKNVEGRCALRFFYYVSCSEYEKDNPPHKSTYSSMEYTHHKLYDEEIK